MTVFSFSCRSLLSAATVLGLCVLAAPAFAAKGGNGPAAIEGAAPALSGIGEIILQTPHVGGTSSTVEASGCSVARGEIETKLYKTLKNYGLPVTPAMKALPQRLDMARANMVPEVVTASSQDGSECAVWISLSVQTDSTVRVPPIETPRNVVVSYWRGGLLVTSSTTALSRAVNDALDALSRQLAQQYRLDQPPKLLDQ